MLKTQSSNQPSASSFAKLLKIRSEEYIVISLQDRLAEGLKGVGGSLSLAILNVFGLESVTDSHSSHWRSRSRMFTSSSKIRSPDWSDAKVQAPTDLLVLFDVGDGGPVERTDLENVRVVPSLLQSGMGKDK